MLLVLAALVCALWIAIILLVDPDGFRRTSRRGPLSGVRGND